MAGSTRSPRLSSPRVNSRSPASASTTPQTTQPILTTGSVPSEVSYLFRTKRVSEIRIFEARIREEADEKSESLRKLLGTRYRDLLQAADEITHMRDAASISVRDALRTVSKTSSTLRDDLNTRAGVELMDNARPTSPTLSDPDLVRRRAVHAVGSRLKHIVDSPEVLYACLEAGELYEAASRFVLAERNFHALIDAPREEEGVAKNFAQTRWSLVAGFRAQILSAAERRLVTPRMSFSEYARVMAAIVVLTERCDVVSVVESMLATRTGWLGDERKRAGKDAGASLRAVSSVVRESISCIAHLFWRDADSIEKLLRDVDVSCAELVRVGRERGGINAAVVTWTGNVKVWLQEQGDSMLAGATSSRQVADALRAVDDVFEADGWAEDCQAALQQPPEFVFNIFKPFISSRAAAVAEECVQNTVRKVLADVQIAWSDINSTLDVGKTIWSSISSQAVSGGCRVVTGDIDSKLRNINEEEDVCRMLLYNGAVSGIVKKLEDSLTDALADVKALTQRVSSVCGAFDSAVRSRFPCILDDLQRRVESVSCGEALGAQSLTVEAQESGMERALFAARLTTAIGTAECVRLAYRFSNSDGEGSGAVNSALTAFRKRAEEVSSMGYQAWAKILCTQLGSQFMKDLVGGKRHCFEMGWSNGGEGNVRDGESAVGNDVNLVRFPTTASTGMVDMFLRACKTASRAGGFALPVEAIEGVRKEMSEVCVNAYRTALREYFAQSDGGATESNDKEKASNEKRGNADTAAMQMLFDVQCLQLLLGDGINSGENWGTGEKSELKKLESEVQRWIDPIDLASCRKSLREAVNSYIARTSTLYGPISRRRDGRSAWSGPVRGMSGVSASANLVSLSKPVARLTYLPAPMPSTYSNAGVGTAGLNAKAVVGALRNETASASAAASRKREAVDTSVAGYASKVSESVGRFGRGFFESLTRKVA